MSANIRVIKSIRLSEDNTVYIRFSGASNLIEAKALESKVSENGDLSYLLLDRLIHKRSETHFEHKEDETWLQRFNVSGAFVSCLVAE